MAKTLPRAMIATVIVHETAKAIKRLFPGIKKLHLVGSRLRHKYARDLDFVAVIKDRYDDGLLDGMNKTVKIGNLSVNLFIATKGSVEPAILEFGLGLAIKRWKKVAKDKGLTLNRYGLWRGNLLVARDMRRIADILGMRLKPELLFSLKHPL